MKLLQLVFSVLLISLQSFAGVVNYSEKLSENINKKMNYLQQQTSLSPQEAWRKVSKFSSISSENLVLDFSETETWVSVSIQNEKNGVEKIHLSFSPAYLGIIELYDRQGNLVSKTGSLDSVEYSQIFYSQILSTNLQPGINDYLIKIKSVGSSVSVVAYSDKEFTQKKKLYEIIFFLLIGSIATLGLYQLFLFVTSKKIVYFYYALYSVGLIGFQFTLTGYFHLLPKDLLFGFPIGYLGSLLVANIALFALISFAYEMLELNSKGKYVQKYRYIFGVVKAICIFAATYVAITQNALAIPITRVLGLSTVVLLIATSIVEFRNKNYNAKLFLISWTPFLIGITVTVLVLNGVLSSSYFTDWVMSFCAVIESLVLAYALGKKIEIADKTLIEEQKLRIVAYEQIEENFKKLKHRDAIIKSYVSPTILTEVALKKDPLSYEPQTLKKCIVFCDLRDYTTITEKTKTEEAVALLNKFFEAMNEAVFNNNGEVDKLIGDAVMATFDNPPDCLAAVQEFRDKFKILNEDRIAAGKHPIYVGIGITYGDVLAANFGSKYKLDRTIVGDVVNVASRFDSLTKLYKVDVICGQSFVEQLVDFHEYRPLDIVKVKGKTESLAIYEIFSHASDKVKKYKMFTKPYYTQALELQNNQNYLKSKELLSELLKDHPAHSYRADEMMDGTLRVVLQSLEGKERIQGDKYDSKKNAA